MTDDGRVHSPWFEYLKQSLEATDDEIDYLKRLHELKAKQRVIEINAEIVSLPSMIIDDFLYHGEWNHARNIEMLKKLNIRNIVTVCDFKLRKEIFNNFNVLWIDLHDKHLDDISEYFDETNEFLNACKVKNEKVLVHCHQGVSRSSSIVLAYLLKYHHDTLHAAYDHLLNRRHIAEPNDGFFLRLIRYEKDLIANKPTSTETIFSNV